MAVYSRVGQWIAVARARNRQVTEKARRSQCRTAAMAGSLSFLLLFWMKYGWRHASADTLYWTLTAIAQSTALLLGLVCASYILLLGRADRSADYLERKRVAVSKRLRPVWPAIVTGFLELQTADQYAVSVLRKLAAVEMVLGAGMLAEDAPDVPATADWCDYEARRQAAHMSRHPEVFFKVLHSIDSLAPFEPGYPRQSVLGDFKRSYASDLYRHVRAVECAQWVQAPVGRTLPLLLMCTLFVSLLLLSITSRTLPAAVVVSGLGVVLAMLATSLMLLAVIINRLTHTGAR